MRIIEDVKLDFNDVLICPKRSTLESRGDVELSRDFVFRNSGYRWSGIPIVAANMDATGTAKMAEKLGDFGMLTCLSKYEKETPSCHGSHYAKTFGIMDPLEVVEEFQAGRAQFICLDVANGYTEKFLALVKEVREQYVDYPIIAGNVATPEMTEALILAGADIVKVGIGSGGMCLTRRVAGVGYPQLSAVMECADAAHGLGGHIMSDGGCRFIGDIAKAFGAGADFVMLGSMLAGYDEGGGVRDEQGNVTVYGMSSDLAMSLNGVGKATYRASEGREVKTVSKGPVEPFLNEILGGLRSACTYVGASRLKDLPKRTTFVRVNRQLNDAWGQD